MRDKSESSLQSMISAASSVYPATPAATAKKRASTPASPAAKRPSTPASPAAKRASTPASPAAKRPSTPASPAAKRPSTPASPVAKRPSGLQGRAAPRSQNKRLHPRRTPLLDRARWYAKALLGRFPSFKSMFVRPPSLRELRAFWARLPKPVVQGVAARVGVHIKARKGQWAVAFCVLVGLTVVVNCRTAPELGGVAVAGQPHLGTALAQPSKIGGAHFSPETHTSDLSQADAHADDPSAPSIADLHTKLGADVALVFRDQQLQAVSADGRVHWRLEHQADVLRCAHDPRTDTLWWTSPNDPENATVSLHVLDLRSPAKAHTVALNLPASAEWVVAHGDEAPALPLPNLFQVAAVVRLSASPSLEAQLGCDGDMAWFCYEGEPSQRGALNFDIQSDYDLTQQATPHNPALLARFAARTTPAPDMPSAEPLPRLASVPTSACLDFPEDCGSAYPLPNTPYWIVTVGNDRGDFLHTFSAVYDPATQMFLDLAGGPPSATPPEGQELFLTVSPTGQHVLTDTGLLALGAPAAGLADIQTACGWLGGGAHFGTP
jgi:hypothetical protein